MTAHPRASLERALRRVVPLLLVALGAGALLLGTPAPALAHDGLTGTVPASGGTVTGLPAAVELEFTGEPLPLGTLVAVTGPDGADVSSGEAEIRGTTVVQALSGEPGAGSYRVEWRSTSSDGHPLSGSFDFTVIAPEGAADTDTTGEGDTDGDRVPAEAAATPAGADADADAAGISPVWPVTGAIVVAGLAAVFATRLRRRG